MSATRSLVINAEPRALLALTPILREGVAVSLRPGLSLRQTMTQDLGFCPQCVEQRVMTVFLDGSPVDDIDLDRASTGCTLALAGALPGVAGIAMRRGSPVGVFREGITHDENSFRPDSGQPLPVTLKLFNSIAVECLAAVLEQGASMRAGRLAELLAAEPDALAQADFSLDGQALDRAGLLEVLAGQTWTLRVIAEVQACASPSPDLATLAAIAEAAGAAIMEVRKTGFTVEYKDDASPLTRADLAAHETILRGLAEHFPGLPVLSEEGQALPYETRARWQRLFIVDPLDGTKEFVKKSGEFCVCIALAEHGFPLFGAVHVPAWGKTYVGGVRLGAFRRETGEGQDGAWQAIAVRQPDPAALTVLASSSHPSPETEAWLASEHVAGRVAERITAGSALKFCLVAEGKADLYPRLSIGMREWDTAAGQAVVEGAGGSVVQLIDGQPGPRLPVNKPDLLSGPFLASAKPAT
jgi:3'(2'), 5'-bisphosphate nucleotidase